MRRFLMKEKSPKGNKRASETQFNHLSDYVDEKRIQKESLKNGLLSFLKYAEEKYKKE
jgi:hypothetical protein